MFMNLKQLSYLLGFMDHYGDVQLQKRILLYHNQQVIKRNPQKFPLECVERIKITDSAGLDELLTRTAAAESLEWGTVFRTQADKDTAVINDILNSHEAETIKIFRERGTRMVCVNIPQVLQKGYNGIHHYHSVDIFSNYALNVVDRTALAGFVHLLTFNLPNSPEIIGYNSRYVYIPTNKSKSELVKVNFKEIWNYLK